MPEDTTANSSQLGLDEVESELVRTYPVDGRVVRSFDAANQAGDFDEDGYELEVHLSKSLEPPNEDVCLLFVFGSKTDAWVTIQESQISKVLGEIQNGGFRTTTRGRQHFASNTGSQPRVGTLTVDIDILKRDGEVVLKFCLGESDVEGATAVLSRDQTEDLLTVLKRILDESEEVIADIGVENSRVE